MYIQPSGCQFCRYFVTALIFQCVWSAVLAGVDVYAMVTNTCLHYCCLVTVFAIGDWVSHILLSMLTMFRFCHSVIRGADFSLICTTLL